MFKKNKKKSEFSKRELNVVSTKFLDKTKAYELYSQICPFSLDTVQIESDSKNERKSEKSLTGNIGVSKFINAFFKVDTQGNISKNVLNSNSLKQIDTLSIKDTDSMILKNILDYSVKLNEVELSKVNDDTLIRIDDLTYYSHDNNSDNMSLIKKALPYIDTASVSNNIDGINFQKISELFMSTMHETIYLKNECDKKFKITLPSVSLDNLDNNYSINDIVNNKISLLGIVKKSYEDRKVELNPILSMIEKETEYSDELVIETEETLAEDSLKFCGDNGDDDIIFIDVIAIFNEITLKSDGEL